MSKMQAKTIYDKIWDSHVVDVLDDGSSLLYIDRHLIHEVTSPQAFEGLSINNRRVWRPDSTKAVSDHNVPTINPENVVDPTAREQLDALTKNCRDRGITHYDVGDLRQGIVHVTGPEQGWCLPGMTIVCGDSHTATNGALASLAFGIGTSEIEHVLATQCLVQRKTKNMRIRVDGTLPKGVTAKDLILHIIKTIGTAGGTGYTLEYTGDAISNLTMEGRMTVCNMSIEAGAKAGLIAFDDTTKDYVEGKPHAPTGELWEQALLSWTNLNSDTNAIFDKEVIIKADLISPQVSWGTSPEMVIGVSETVPDPQKEDDNTKRVGMENALDYMGLEPGTPMTDIEVDKVFIGSCTNSRIEDLREVAELVENKKVAHNIKLAMIVPGSGLVKKQAEEEGLHHIFMGAGFEWREPGCSMCLGMNPDQLEPGERCASTSNRNFEGRQGRGGRTHLVSPAMAAAAALFGHFADVREIG